MSNEPPVFLARDSYRRKRLEDSARLVPLAGLILLLMPLMWAARAGTSGALIYVFSIWALLILVVGLLSRALMSRVGVSESTDAADNAEQ